MDHDAIVIGGSYAGQSAALHLARARRRVAVIDSGERRNRFASHAHGLVGMDGVPPGEIAARGKQQLLGYPTVDWRDGIAERVTRDGEMFVVHLRDGSSVRGIRLILATGVRDELPAIPGLQELWGTHVFHCPYCHGYELGGRPVAVLGVGEVSMHHAVMLPDWGPTTLLVNDSFEPNAEQLAQLARRGTAIENAKVTRVQASGEDLDVTLADGRTLRVAGVFVASKTTPPMALVESIGCAIEPGMVAGGAFIRVDAMQQTTVPGVFACGDAARGAGSLPLAAADGTMAGVACHRSLMFS